MTEQTSTVACKYPGLRGDPRAGGRARPGRAVLRRPGHNKLTAWRERKRLADAERGATTTDADTEQPVTMARVHGAETPREMRAMATSSPRRHAAGRDRIHAR